VGRQEIFFHIFSDPFASINARFGYANPSTMKGTVMSAIGVRWETHSLTVDVDAMSSDHKNVSITLDGQTTLLSHNSSAVSIEPCSQATLLYPQLIITMGMDHTLTLTWHKQHSSHINTTFLGFNLEVPLESDPSVYQGVLGQTATKNLTKPRTDWFHFSVKSLLSTSIQSPTQPIHCSTSSPVKYSSRLVHGSPSILPEKLPELPQAHKKDEGSNSRLNYKPRTPKPT